MAKFRTMPFPGDDPARPELKPRMEAALKMLHEFYNQGSNDIGLLLVVADRGPGGHSDYLASATGQECIGMLEEVLKRWRARH